MSTKLLDILPVYRVIFLKYNLAIGQSFHHTNTDYSINLLFEMNFLQIQIKKI